MTGVIVCHLDEGRGVVIEAPDEAEMSVDLLAEIALGRGIDAHADDLGLVLGVEGMGCGVVRYRIGECNWETRSYPLTRMS